MSGLVDGLPSAIDTMLLDMNGTFMFGHDHLEPGTDYFPAYQRLRGRKLDAAALNGTVERLVARLDALYRDPANDTAFPTVHQVARSLFAGELSAAETARIELVLAAHEMGAVPEAHAAALARLSERFRLIVLSNLWSAAVPWRRYLTETVGNGVFSGFVFSSDIGVNKPAPGIFEYALTLAEANPGRAVMVGDSLERDIRPAAALGMVTVWITDAPAAAASGATFTAPSLVDVLQPPS